MAEVALVAAQGVQAATKAATVAAAMVAHTALQVSHLSAAQSVHLW
tara:strand:- start:88 stop:225 length:138 start_codon:yes stop_codon:yes gene_type:complete